MYVSKETLITWSQNPNAWHIFWRDVHEGCVSFAFVSGRPVPCWWSLATNLCRMLLFLHPKIHFKYKLMHVHILVYIFFFNLINNNSIVLLIRFYVLHKMLSI